MDEIKAIPPVEFEVILGKTNFLREKLVKDYHLTLILFLLKNVKGIYFKGGTALNKIFLNHTRLSEDLDFTITRVTKEVQSEISQILNNSGFFREIAEDKNVAGFLRMIIRYNSDLGSGEIFIDLNQRAKLSLKPEEHKVNHFYSPFIPDFSIKTIAKEELFAEKVAATIGRNKPRDHFDVYQMIHAKIPFNIEMIKKKCHESRDEFSIIKMFNKAQTLKNRWDKDMASLISEPIAFQEIIKFLAKHFNLKEEKEKIKNLKNKTKN